MRLRFSPGLVLVGLLLAGVPAQSWAQASGAVGAGGDQGTSVAPPPTQSSAPASVTSAKHTWIPGTGGGGSDPDSWDEGTQGWYRVDLTGVGQSHIDLATGQVDCQGTVASASFDLHLPSMVLGTTPPGPADSPAGDGGVVNVPTFAWISAGPLTGSSADSVSWTTCDGSTPVPQTLTATMSYAPSSMGSWQWQWGDGSISSGSSPSSVLGAPGSSAIHHTYERSSLGQTLFPDKGHAYTIEFDYALDMTFTTSLTGGAGSGENFPHISKRGRVYPVRDVQSVLTAP